MSDNTIVNKVKELRKDLDKETSYFQEQMDLPINGHIAKSIQSDHNSIQLNKGVALSKWVRKIASQFESVDPFYK